MERNAKLGKLLDDMVYNRKFGKWGNKITLYTIHELIDVYNGVTKETVNSLVNEILNSCGVQTKPKGIGWEVMD